MSISKLVIFGAGGHAKVIVDIIESQPSCELVGFIDDSLTVGTRILGHAVIGGKNSLPQLMRRYEFSKGIIGIGDNYVRSKLVEEIYTIVADFEFVNCIHKSANISNHCHVGVGNVVMPGVTVNASSAIGNHCILNTNSCLDHDCLMKDYSSLGPNASVGGGSEIGTLSYIGISATVFHKIIVGDNCVIGGGSVVRKDARDNSVNFGSPAKYISNRTIGDKYL